jgi:ornithine cyclodeaminase/alanine dehydrogenase-like protein (mu-crystallin family)
MRSKPERCVWPTYTASWPTSSPADCRPQRADQIFVFDSTGTAIADLAAANAIFEIACADTAAPQFRLAA